MPYIFSMYTQFIKNADKVINKKRDNKIRTWCVTTVTRKTWPHVNIASFHHAAYDVYTAGNNISLTIIHTYIHTYKHTYIHTNIHTYIQTYMYTYIHTYIHNIHTKACMHKNKHTNVLPYLHACIQKLEHTYTRTHKYVIKDTHLHT